MKMNVKMFKKLTNPVEILEVDGKVVEVHYMNDTDYLAQYAGQGYFFVWSSDGNSYKLLIEKGYYEELDELFLPEVNALQIKLYEDLSKSRRKVYLGLVLPVFLIIVALLVATYFIEELKAYTVQIAVGGLLVFLVVNIFQSSILKRRVDKLRNNYFDDLEELFGIEKLEELVVKQREYHAAYFDFDADEEEEVEKVEEKASEPKAVPAWVKGDAEKEEVLKTDTEPAEDFEEKEKVVEDLKEESPLSVLPMEELKDFARDRKISGFSTMRKSELLESLPKGYEKLRVVELQALARKEEIPNFSTMRKDELIEALKKGVVLIEEEPLVEEVEEEIVVLEEKRIKVVAEDGTVDLSVLTLEELKAFAKDRKISGFSTMRKGELLESLPTNISELRLTELKALAKEHKLNNFSTMRKDELIEELTLGIPVVEKAEEIEEVVELISVLNEDGTANLNLLTIEELKTFAKDRKISGFSTMRKGELALQLPSSIDDLRTVELKALARVRKVPNFSTMRKQELIEAIK